MSNEELNQVGVGDKVYAVSSGCYSDYSINCVFRTREEAEGWISKRWNPKEYEVEEWGFDTYNPSQLIGFGVELCLESGDMIDGWESRHEGPAQAHAFFLKETPSYYRYCYSKFRLVVNCLARDKDHAIKIASEHRRIVLASPLWEVWKNSPDPSLYEMKSHGELVSSSVVHP